MLGEYYSPYSTWFSSVGSIGHFQISNSFMTPLGSANAIKVFVPPSRGIPERLSATCQRQNHGLLATLCNSKQKIACTAACRGSTYPAQKEHKPDQHGPEKKKHVILPATDSDKSQHFARHACDSKARRDSEFCSGWACWVMALPFILGRSNGHQRARNEFPVPSCIEPKCGACHAFGSGMRTCRPKNV